METIKFEYRQSSFFKYRYAQEFPANYATIAETWEMENQVQKYKFSADFLLRAINVKINLEDHKISYGEFIEITELSKVYVDKHGLMFPIQLSFFEKAWKWYVPSTPFGVSDTVIVSAAPKKIVTRTLSFLAMDSKVIMITIMTVIILSSLLTLYWILISSKRWSVRKMIAGFFRNIWNHSSLLCAEPMPRIPPVITPRLIASTWLLSVTIILFFLSCFLKTEFCIETYQTIESLSDLIRSDLKPQIIRGSLAHENLKLWAEIDPEIKDWYSEIEKDETNFCTLMDLLIIDGYEDVLVGKRALIITRTYLTWLIGEVLTSELESKQVIADLDGLYISNGIHSDYLHIIYNRSYITNTPERREIGHVSVYPVFESKPYNYMDLVFIYLLDYVTWKKPLESVSNLNITSVSAPFYLLFILALVSATLVTIEILF